MKAPQLIDADNSLVVVIDIQEKLFPAIAGAEAVVERAHWLVSAAQELGIPFWFTEQYPEGLGKTVAQFKHLQSEKNTIIKHHFSAWQQPDFQSMLRMSERQQVILVGTETHVCVLQTALDLLHFGFDVFIVDEAVGSRADSSKRIALERMENAGAQIINGEMAVFEWLHDSAAPSFKTISKKYLR
ncbi:MAG: isochorismatase family enzyme [Idiomarinaceae bacterium HL-53]|nr:MAG: isochorismatase family enzyme [Idiomarinaceae bacterium HL-53]CUS47759.1 Nicotinamidase-related amidase [Idiomarinaceae bacterium HL-53]